MLLFPSEKGAAILLGKSISPFQVPFGVSLQVLFGSVGGVAKDDTRNRGFHFSVALRG